MSVTSQEPTRVGEGLMIPGATARPLGTRLTRAAMAAAGAALLVASLLLNLFVHLSSRATLMQDMQAQARVAADNIAAALLFTDVGTAHETLASLQASTPVHSATLFDSAGRVVAFWQRPGTSPTPPLAVAERALVLTEPLWRDGLLYVAHPVPGPQGTLGRVELAVTLQPLHERTLTLGAISMVSGLFALAIAYLLAMGLRRDIDHTEARLDELAYFDPVTGLYNRHAAHEHLQACVDRARREGSPFGLMLLDLDDFKLVNDTLGHAVGDDVLRQLASRLGQGLRGGDVMFRFGGDEFVVVCDGLADDAEAARRGQAVLRCLAPPLQVGGHEVYMRGSLGLALFPRDAGDAQQLLRAADAAMYAAKAAGKNTCAVFDPSVGRRMHSHLQVDTELRRAIERDELVLHFQPIVALDSGETVGVEALVRWQHPERGLLMPADFIDVAETSGLIVELGGWVLRAAAHQLARWREQGLGELYIAVNVSGRQIKRGVLLQQVEQALALTNADPARLQIELTEHTLVENIGSNLEVLGALRSRGMTIAVDDFGTGQSSLAYLKRLPIDKFKIDRSFVRELPHEAGDVAIVTAVVSMARALGLQVVAEGVESEAQRDLLRRLGCDHAQGFLFSRPVPADKLQRMLARRASGVGAPAAGERGSAAYRSTSSAHKAQ